MLVITERMSVCSNRTNSPTRMLADILPPNTISPEAIKQSFKPLAHASVPATRIACHIVRPYERSAKKDNGHMFSGTYVL